MDTNLKKTRKFKNLVIALIVLIPALILTALYPQMERAMLDKKQQWLTEWEENKEKYELEQEKRKNLSDVLMHEDTAAAVEVPTVMEESAAIPEKLFYLQDGFINYAIESSYYQYAMFLQDATSQDVFTEVLDHYGWINDYYTFTNATPYYVEYVHRTEDGETEEYNTAVEATWNDLTPEEAEKILKGEDFSEPRKTQILSEGLLGFLIVEYDSFGKLTDIRITVNENVEYNKEIYQRAKASIEQYKENATYYVQNNMEDNQQNLAVTMQVCPKNFRGVYLIYKDNELFVNNYYEEEPVDLYYTVEPYHSPQDLYMSTGAYCIVAALAILVFLAAMILPLFKKLETGREKLFSLPFEITLCIAAAGIALAVGMCILMSITTMTEIEAFMANGNAVELLGYRFSAGECYYTLLAVNFLGWALSFFVEYICAAHLRQFFAGPKYYIRHRFLGIMLLCWIYKKIKSLIKYVLDIDINEKMHSSIVKIVVANGMIAALLCCIWFAGTLGVVIYSVVLYILLKKYGSKLQKQYQSILHATGQMADGNLQIRLEEDLGIFEPLGNELKGVNQGFAKAVAEEAKSQNMKSELITNVSHDLKTPLTAIITYVDLLMKEDITEEERKAYIETLDMKSQRLKVLIEDLFEVSKANSGNVQMNFMEVDAVKLLKEVRVEMSDKIEQSDLDFRWKLPDEKVMLHLDGQRTYRIFENILNNAIKYAMPFTRVYIEMVEEETEVVITFKNISAQELKMDVDYLTERFVRGDSSRNSEGSGLGLAIAKSFTELQNGQFEIGVDGDLFKVCIRFLK